VLGVDTATHPYVELTHGLGAAITSGTLPIRIVPKATRVDKSVNFRDLKDLMFLRTSQKSLLETLVVCVCLSWLPVCQWSLKDNQLISAIYKLNNSKNRLSFFVFISKSITLAYSCDIVNY